jgi:hypothetical protein
MARVVAMKKTARHALSLQRTTLRTLGTTDLAAADGGTVARTHVCPPPTVVTISADDACPTRLFCPRPPGPSIIVNPPELSR